MKGQGTAADGGILDGKRGRADTTAVAMLALARSGDIAFIQTRYEQGHAASVSPPAGTQAGVWFWRQCK